MPPPNPEFPFQKTAIDLFDLHEKGYMVYTDKYTGWVEVALLPSGRAKVVYEVM